MRVFYVRGNTIEGEFYLHKFGYLEALHEEEILYNVFLKLLGKEIRRHY